MESENKSLENDKKDKIPFALRNKKTGEVLFCTVVAVFTEFAANNYKVEIELKDKNGVTRKIFFPMSNTCDLGKIKLIYEKSEEVMKLLDLIGISRYNLESNFGWKYSLKNKKNIYDEYGIEEPSSIAGNVVSGLYELNSNENNPVNKNLDISYGGYEDWDDQSTALNDFWHRFYEKICTEKKYQWMKFYRNLNMTLYGTDLSCHGVLTTALSNGNIETLRKEIFNFGHFVGPDSYIYDFNKIYPNEDINLYKNYLGFILWNKLPDKNINEADYAKEILNYISEKNEDLRKFITENQVQYNDEDGRFEMTQGGENIHDANAWIYSAFFPTPSENYPKYSFYKCKSYLPEEYQRNMETKKINDYGPVWSNKFKLENQEILKVLDEAEAEGEVSSAHEEFVKNVAKSEEWRKENFNFIKNMAAYFKRDFNFEDVVIFDEEETKKLEKALEVKSIDSLLKRFFKNPNVVKKCLVDNKPDIDWCLDRFERHNSLSDEGMRLVDIIFNNIKETSIAKECKKMSKYNVQYGFARALFECLQVNGDYDKFIEELRINLSFYIRNNQDEYLDKNGMKLKTEFRQKFVKFKIEIQKLKAEYSSKFREYLKNHDSKINMNDPEYQEIVAISKATDEKQKEMDKEFLSIQQFNFLKEEKMIDKNDFAQINTKVLEIAKQKINDLDLKKLISEKKMSDNNEKELRLEIYNRFEDTIKNNPNISYEKFVSYLNKEILIYKYDGLEKTLFNMIWEFELELKNNKNLDNNYWDNMVVMRLYHLVQHFFHAAGILSDVNELKEDDMREIALNMEDVKFYLTTNPKKLILDEKKSAVENLIIRLFKGTSLEKNISDYMGWFKNGVNDFCQMTTEVNHITQSNGVSLATKNRQLKNGFFVNCNNGLIKNFYVPLQTVAELSKKEFKPLIKSDIKLVDPNESCDLTLSDDEWEILDKDQIFDLSDKSFDILINTATYITPEHLKKFMDCWQREDYEKKMEDHLLETKAEKSIFGLINKGIRVNDEGENKEDGNDHRKELFPMIKELYKNCQKTSLENAIEFLKMQEKCHYGCPIKISLEDLKNDFDFAVESMNKIWFQADKLNVQSSYFSDDYFALLNELDKILCQFEGEKFEPEGKEAQKKAMDSHPELILALYILYYFGTKNYDSELRNIKNYEEEIFKFKDWQDFLDSISSERYDRKNPRLRKMAEDFFTRWKKKDAIINIVIDNYKDRGVFSSKGIDKDKAKNDNLIENENETNKRKNQIEMNRRHENQKLKLPINTSKEKIDNNNLIKSGKNEKENRKRVKSNNKKTNVDSGDRKSHEQQKPQSEEPTIINNNIANYNIIIVNQYQSDQSNRSKTRQEETGKINQHNKTKIGLIILTVLIFLLLIGAIISTNPVFIKAMVIVSLIYTTLIIILICYKDHVSKNETQRRIALKKNLPGCDRGKGKSLNLNYESEEKINITQQYTNDQENSF